eukprot:GCRY01002343.1.p1 GENE.GCRY01002343.1~~GCRY01002343.1.p1  ORF type:complete len:202 (-),score=39.95 GCRY01002343.1:379-984(-)
MNKLGDFTETLAVIEEIKSVYDIQEDLTLISEIKNKTNKAEAAFVNEQNETKQLIKSFQNRVDEKHARIASSSTEAFEAKMAEIKEEISSLNSNIEEENSNISILNSTLKEMEEEKQELMQQAEDASAKHKKELPRLKNILRLFLNVSNIRWHQESTHIKGYVTKGQGSNIEMVPFDYDPSRLSQYFIINKLWDLIGSPEE